MGAGRGAHALAACGLVVAALAACKFDASGLRGTLDAPGPEDQPAVTPERRDLDRRDSPSVDSAAVVDVVAPDTYRAPDQAQPCGAVSQPCCKGTDCNASLACIGGSCAPLPRIDGSGTAADNTDQIKVEVTTTTANALIYVVAVLSTDQPVKSISSSPSLAWSLRANHNYHGNEAMVTCHAIAPTPGKISVTVYLDSGTTHWAAAAFGVSGVNVAAPFDGNYVTASGSSSTASAHLTTTGPALIVGLVGVGANPPKLATGTGYSTITTASNGTARSLAAEYSQVAAAVTGLAVSFGLSSGTDWGVVADAVRPP
jgi:hypothetical protein